MPAKFDGSASIRGSSESLRMILLTVSLAGIQLCWGTEMAYCAPYLLSLGLTKSLLSLVWNVGPLSGLITQPVVGVLADRSTSRFGRRRPVMVIGSILVAIALLVLGWTKEIVHFFFPAVTGAANTITIIVAVLAMYLMDFSINAVQACVRALIVDTLPREQQQTGGAWASRMIAVGNIAGYLAGTIDLRAIFGTTLGNTQFKQLVVVSGLLLIACIAITCFAVKERVLVERPKGDGGVSNMLALIWRTIRHLPPNIWSICTIIFFAWIGWFPFQIYSTTFVAEVLKRYDHEMLASLKKSNDPLGDIARVGSRALVLFSCVSLVSSIVLPWVIRSPDNDKNSPPEGKFAEFSHSMNNYKPSLTTTWIWAHFSFAILMFLTLFAGRVWFATLIVSLCGIAWTLMTWAPFSFVGEEINKLSKPRASSEPTNASETTSLLHESDLESGDIAKGKEPATHSAATSIHSIEPASEPDTNSADVAGVYLGILNIFTCLPQFLGIFMSFIVFSILEPGKSPEFTDNPDVGLPGKEKKEGVNAIAVCLALGGVCTLMAARNTIKFRHDNRHNEA